MGDDYQRQVYQLNQLPENQVRRASHPRPRARVDVLSADPRPRPPRGPPTPTPIHAKPALATPPRASRSSVLTCADATVRFSPPTSSRPSRCAPTAARTTPTGPPSNTHLPVPQLQRLASRSRRPRLLRSLSHHGHVDCGSVQDDEVRRKRPRDAFLREVRRGQAHARVAKSITTASPARSYPRQAQVRRGEPRVEKTKVDEILIRRRRRFLAIVQNVRGFGLGFRFGLGLRSRRLCRPPRSRNRRS